MWSWFLVVTWGISGYAYLFSILFPLSISLIITILSNTVVQVLLSGTVAFLDPGTMMGSWPLRVLAVLSTGYMACDSYLVSFGNQFPVCLCAEKSPRMSAGRGMLGSIWVRAEGPRVKVISMAGV